MPLGTEVGLGPDNIVLDGEAAVPPKKGHNPPIFGPCLLWPSSCMYQDTTWYRGSLSLGDIMVDGDPAPRPLKGHSCTPNFRPVSVVAKRLDGLRCDLVRR